MSIMDKTIAALTPDADDEKKREARTKARAAAGNADWLAMALDHHERIEACFAALKGAADPQSRRKAQKELAEVLTAHSLAEDVVLYPAMSRTDHTVHAEIAYTQQSAAKVNMAALETMDPGSEDYLDKVGHIEGAVTQHIYQEEHTWFIDLKNDCSAEMNNMLTQRYREEFERYMNGGSGADDLSRAHPTMASTPVGV